MIRFWDTSALAKVFLPVEPGHDRALRLMRERRIPEIRHATSMLVAVELVCAVSRRTRNRRLVGMVRNDLDAFEQMEFGAMHRDVALRLAMQGRARGADTAIGAQAVLLAMASRETCEFVTADAQQAELMVSATRSLRAEVRVVQLPL